MITDINNESITPGQYKYWLPRWSRSVKVTVKEDGVLYIRSKDIGSKVDVYSIMALKDIRSNAMLERIED